MKKILAVFLLVFAMLFVASCGSENNENETPENEGGENNYGDYDGNGTTDSIEDTVIIPIPGIPG